jgi:hypothetical protein
MKLRSLAASALLGISAASNFAVAAPVIRDGGYYEENANVACSAGASCTALFTAPAANRRLTIDRLSCSIVAGAHNVQRGLFGKVVGANIQRPQFLFPQFVVKNGSQNQYIINTEAKFEFEIGERPAIRIVTASSTSQAIVCQIVGRIIEVL